MDKVALEKKLKSLEPLVAIAELPGMKVLEEYAKTQREACKEALYNERDPDPAVYMASCSYHRGQGDTWMWIANMRSIVASEIAGVRQQLAALRKEA